MNNLVIISGPAGVGKTTVAKSLLKAFPNLRTTVTYTTRRPRQNSVEDKKMYYITPDEFNKRQKAGEFLEWAKVHGDFYGTHKQETFQLLEKNPALFNIDVQGAEQLIEKFPNNCVTIFLLPENYEQMVDHIKNRGEMTDGDFRARLKSAEIELKKKDKFQYQIVNAEGKLTETIDKIAKIIQNKLETTKTIDKN
mgnify:CR=1 FL=1